MMTQSIRMNVSPAPGALLRVLGVVQRRGYQAINVIASPDFISEGMLLRLTVESDRPVTQLVNHLAKLHDVRRLEVRS